MALWHREGEGQASFVLGVVLEEGLEGILTPDVGHVLDAELVELDAFGPHAVDHQPGGHVHEHPLVTVDSCYEAKKS
jgi:hypothetical protein